MAFRKLTISYDDFHDEEHGLVRYLADAVMMLIRKNDMDALQELMNNIAVVSADLEDLNNEIIGKKKDYDKLMNRINALQADMAQKMAAQADLEAEMRKLVGSSDEERLDSFDDPLAEFDQVLSGFDQDLGDDDEFAGLSEITVENVIGNDDVPETFKRHGIVFGDDISRLAAAESYEIEQEDDIYADFVDLHVDVDQGYKPVDEAARSLGLSVPKDPEPIDDFDAAYSQFDDTYDDMFDDAAGDEEDFFDDVYDDLDDFSNGSVDSVDDMFAPAPAQTQKPSGGGIPGVIDMDLFR